MGASFLASAATGLLGGAAADMQQRGATMIAEEKERAKQLREAHLRELEIQREDSVYQRKRTDELADAAADRKSKERQSELDRQSREKIAGMKVSSKAGGGSSSSEFDKQMKELESLYKKRADIEGGIDPITGETLDGSQASAALGTINSVIDDRERYMQETSPDLWQKYRPSSQGAGLLESAGNRFDPVSKEEVLNALQAEKLAKRHSEEDGLKFLEEMSRERPELYRAVIEQKMSVAKEVDRAEKSTALSEKKQQGRDESIRQRISELRKRLESPMVVDHESIKQQIVKLENSLQ